MKLDPKLDLVLERNVDVAPELVWKAWTQPEHLKPWFTPAPWRTVDCAIDLHPGGRFWTVMRSPEGKDHPSEGCYLEVVPNRRLVWTSALKAGYRPVKGDSPLSFPFTAMLELEPKGQGTRYVAAALHADEDSRKQHEAMGFHEGWGKALDQLVEYVKKARL